MDGEGYGSAQQNLYNGAPSMIEPPPHRSILKRNKQATRCRIALSLQLFALTLVPSIHTSQTVAIFGFPSIPVTMGLSAFEILDIVELIFFVPALLASGYVVYKHGHGRRLGWRFLVMICLFRLIGAICSLISVHHPSSGLTIAYDVMNSFGLSAVIYTALGLLNRVDEGMTPYGLPRHIFRLLSLPGLAGLILSIIGSTNIFNNDPSDVSTGFKEIKAAMILFLVVFVADILITAKCFLGIRHIREGERRLLFATATAIPFMAVRMTYSLLCVFAQDPKWFSAWSLQWTAILVHGIMGVLMEAIVVVIFLFAGLTTTAATNKVIDEGQEGHVVKLDARSV